MKKIAVLLLCACMLGSLATGAAAQANVVETTPDYVVSLDSQTIPHDALASGGHASAITRYELPIDMNARVEFVDPLLQQSNSEFSTLGGDRRVYVGSSYVMERAQIVGYSVGPIHNQKLLASVAKGKTYQRSDTLEVSGTISISGTYNVNVLNLVKSSLTGSVSGTVKKTYGTTETYSGPPESSPYTTRNYYGAINYDRYDTTVVQYDAYDEYIGNVYQGRVTETKYIPVDSVLRPINIEYHIDQNYS